MVVIIIWYTVAKYQYLKWQWIFYFLRICFLFSITANTLTGIDSTYELHDGCLVRSRKCLPFTTIWVHPRFLVGLVLLNIYFYSVLSTIVCLHLLVFSYGIICPVILRLLISTFGFVKQLTYVVFKDDNLLIHVTFTNLNNILTVTEYILVTKYIYVN